MTDKLIKVEVKCPCYKLPENLEDRLPDERICVNANQWNGHCILGLTDYCAWKNAEKGMLKIDLDPNQPIIINLIKEKVVLNPAYISKFIFGYIAVHFHCSKQEAEKVGDSIANALVKINPILIKTP